MFYGLILFEGVHDQAAIGVSDSLLIKCADEVYPDLKCGAEIYLDQLGEHLISHWRPFDYEKALVATITSVLKP
jgi:hypothetical protein